MQMTMPGMCGLLLVNLLFIPVRSTPIDVHHFTPTELHHIQNALHNAFRGEYHQTLKIFQTLDADSLGAPVGEFGCAYIYQHMMDEARSTAFDSAGYAFADSAIRIGERLKKIDKGNMKNVLFLAGAYGMRGIRKLYRDKYFSAFRDGLKARSLLLTLEKHAPRLHDMYYGLGVYHYWKSRGSRYFWWLPFISDDRDKGIKEIKHAIQHGLLSEYAARLGLLPILNNTGAWEEMLTVATYVQQVYPENLFCRWYVGKAYTRLQRWKDAVSYWEETEQRLLQLPYYGIDGLVECWYYRAVSLEGTGNYRQAAELYQQILQQDGKLNPFLSLGQNYLHASKRRLENIDHIAPVDRLRR